MKDSFGSFNYGSDADAHFVDEARRAVQFLRAGKFPRRLSKERRSEVGFQRPVPPQSEETEPAKKTKELSKKAKSWITKKIKKEKHFKTKTLQHFENPGSAGKKKQHIQKIGYHMVWTSDLSFALTLLFSSIG